MTVVRFARISRCFVQFFAAVVKFTHDRRWCIVLRQFYAVIDELPRSIQLENVPSSEWI